MKYKETRFTFCRWHCTRWVMVICVSFSFLSWVTTRVYPEVILTGLSSCLFPTSWVVICCCTQTLQASVSLLCDWSSHSQTRQDCLPGTLHLQDRMVMMNICQYKKQTRFANTKNTLILPIQITIILPIQKKHSFCQYK